MIVKEGPAGEQFSLHGIYANGVPFGLIEEKIREAHQLICTNFGFSLLLRIRSETVTWEGKTMLGWTAIGEFDPTSCPTSQRRPFLEGLAEAMRRLVQAANGGRRCVVQIVHWRESYWAVPEGCGEGVEILRKTFDI